MKNATTMLRLLSLLLVLICTTIFANPSTLAQSTDEANAASPGRVRLILPPALYAVPNVQTNVYFDNVILTTNVRNYAFDVHCTKGAQQVERWTFTPKPEDVGQYEFTLEVRDEQNALVARASTMLHVVPADAGADRDLAMLFIGDSLTHASVYPKQVHDRFQSEGNPTLTLIGSHEPGRVEGPIRHEGYGGWTAERFATHYTGIAREGDYRKRGSPFLYQADENAAPTLDFARYCDDVAAGRRPEFVTIFLGPNDVFRATDDTIEATIDNMLSHMQSLIDMILADSPTTQIGILLPVPPAATQDAFGANYKAGQTRWQYRRNQHRLVERMLDHFAAGGHPNVELVPAVVNLDCQRNYPVAAAAPANPYTDVQISRQNNGVHPAPSGYHQIGDTVYAWLKAKLAAAPADATH